MTLVLLQLEYRLMFSLSVDKVDEVRVDVGSEELNVLVPVHILLFD